LPSNKKEEEKRLYSWRKSKGRAPSYLLLNRRGGGGIRVGVSKKKKGESSLSLSFLEERGGGVFGEIGGRREKGSFSAPPPRKEELLGKKEGTFFP